MVNYVLNGELVNQSNLFCLVKVYQNVCAHTDNAFDHFTLIRSVLMGSKGLMQNGSYQQFAEGINSVHGCMAPVPLFSSSSSSA